MIYCNQISNITLSLDIRKYDNARSKQSLVSLWDLVDDAGHLIVRLSAMDQGINVSTFKTAMRVNRIRISPSVAAASVARQLKAQGRDIVDLTVGEPDFDTPDHVKAEAVAAIGRGETKYTAVNGTPALRAAIRADVQRRLHLEYQDDEVCIGGGAKQIIFLALMGSLDAGDEVIIPAPYWVSYPDMVMANDGTPVIVPCGEEQSFKLTPESLEQAITAHTRWVIINSPSNPTGAAYTEAEFKALALVLAKHPQVWLLCDEIYDQVWFGQTPCPSIVTVAPELKDRTLIVNGMSKSFAMTGWRIGFGLGPVDVIKAINKLQSQISSCPSSISQAATVAALTGDQSFIAETGVEYRKRRDYAVKRLNAVNGIQCSLPDGAFYLFPNCAGVIGKTTPEGKTINNDLDFVLYLLEQAGVATIHGAAYGLSPYFRLSFATSMDIIKEACDRIERACDALVGGL